MKTLKLRTGKSMEQKQRPLMLKDFLRDDSRSKRSKHDRPNSTESATTMRYLLEMGSENDQKAPKWMGIVPLKTALVKAISKLLPFSARCSSQQGQSTIVLQKHHINKLSSTLKRVDSIKESHHVKASLSRGLSVAIRKISLLSHYNKSKVESPTRVRDIVQWRSFGGEDVACNQYCNSRIGATNSFSYSEMSSNTWSEIGNKSYSPSIVRSFSRLSRDAEELKDEMLLLNHQSKEGDEVKMVEPLHANPIHQQELDSVDLADSNEQAQTHIQQLEAVDDGSTIYSSVEGYEEKEQSSPVSVLDFPFEEDKQVTSLSFEKSLMNLERRKQQLLEKIGRFETLTKHDPVNLEKRFSSLECESSDEDSGTFTEYYDNNSVEDPKDGIEDIEECIIDILNGFLEESVKEKWGSFELLVIDVFREELSFGCKLEEGELFKIVSGRIKEWLAKRNEVDESKEFCVKEMERNQDWRKSKMGEGEIASEMEVEVIQYLVHELLIDLMD